MTPYDELDKLRAEIVYLKDSHERALQTERAAIRIDERHRHEQLIQDYESKIATLSNTVSELNKALNDLTVKLEATEKTLKTIQGVSNPAIQAYNKNLPPQVLSVKVAKAYLLNVKT